MTALATDHLAGPAVATAAVIGTGPVAQGQMEALELVRPVEEVRVFARTPAHRRRFIELMAGRASGRLVECDSVDDAVETADLVTLATSATDPVLLRRHLRPGMHINSVGPASRERAEVDPAAFAAFDRVVCDTVDLVFAEAGDASAAVEHGVITADAAIELSAVVVGRAPGRGAAEEITLFKSVGAGVQDLILAARLLAAAERHDVGSVVDDFVSVKRFEPGPGPAGRRGG